MSPAKKKNKRTDKRKAVALRSMTGFGKAVEKSPYGKFTVEIRTLNHKGLHIICNTFDGFFLLEEKVEKLLKDNIHRGKIFVSIAYEPAKDRKALQSVVLDRTLAKEYSGQINRLKEDLGLSGEIDVSQLVGMPGVLNTRITVSEKEIWSFVEKAARRAVEKLMLYRRKEGRRTATEFRQRIKKIKDIVLRVEKNQKKSVKEYRERLARKIKSLKKELDVGREKIETEVAAFARNCDISEEVNRLKGHLLEFTSAMSPSMEDSGKKLDFIAQEMQREANTIGAKSDNFDIAKDVIEIKTQIEKMREQIRNIE